MSWRKEVSEMAARAPRYPYKAHEDTDFRTTGFPILSLLTTRISRPLRRPLDLKPGIYSLVIVDPLIKRRASRPIVVLENPRRGQKHGDLSRTRPVITSGQIEITKEQNVISIPRISNRSGHYKPELESLDVAEKIMRIYDLPLDVNLEKVDYNLDSPKDVIENLKRRKANSN